MDKSAVWVGVDVSKDQLTVAAAAERGAVFAGQ
jgi:hypothetical protein